MQCISENTVKNLLSFGIYKKNHNENTMASSRNMEAFFRQAGIIHWHQ